MTTEALKYINDALVSKNISYEYMEFTSDISNLQSYWVGSYSEVTPNAEDGLRETQFILTGTGKGTWLALEQAKDVVEALFPALSGRKAILSNGNGIAVFYENAFPVPTGIDALKRLQINLKIKEWKV